jgi:hypothetical protein
MKAPITISPIELFREYFPWLEPKKEGNTLTFECGSILQAEKIYKRSLQLVMQHRLPLMISLSVHWLNAYCFDINVIVKEVPEEESFELAAERLNQAVDHIQKSSRQ